MKFKVATWFATIAGLVMASLMVAVPSASAVDPLENPSGTWVLDCGGAKAKIQIKWKSTSEINVWWRLTDTESDGKRPVLRIHAHDYQHDSSAYPFRNGLNYFILDGGGTTTGRKFDWNPGGIGGINHLYVQLKDGTSGEGTDCTAKKNIFNWTALAYNNALQKQGRPYEWGAEGPDSYDCSGLVWASYHTVGNIPDWSRKSADGQYRWARSNSSPSKMYAKSVSYSDAMKGDLIFYDWDEDGRADHVSFYAGSGKVFDALDDGIPVGYHNEYGSADRLGIYRILGVQSV